LLLIGTLGMMASAVDWEDTMTDPVDDVTDGSRNTVTDHDHVDIVSVSMTEDGDDINVTLTLAGEHASDGLYYVYIEADYSESYQLWRSAIHFSVTKSVPVTGYHSADGTQISWVIAKADLAVRYTLDIYYAEAFFSDEWNDSIARDEVGNYNLHDEMMESSIFMEAEFKKINKMVLSVTITYKGRSAMKFRMMMDENSDGTVSADEVQTTLDAMSEDDGEDDDLIALNMTVDGKDYRDLTSKYKMEGVPGPTDSTGKLKIVRTETATWPEVEDMETHTYAFEQGDDFIGGDEPWEDEVDVTFRLIVPDGWVLETDGLPSGMDDFIKNGDTIEYKNEDLGSGFKDTFGQVDELVIKKEESPGPGLVVALAAVVLAGLVTRRRH